MVQQPLCGKHRNGHSTKHKGETDSASVPPHEFQAHSLTHDTLGTTYSSQAPGLPQLSELVLTGRSIVLNATLETFLIPIALSSFSVSCAQALGLDLHLAVLCYLHKSDFSEHFVLANLCHLDLLLCLSAWTTLL